MLHHGPGVGGGHDGVVDLVPLEHQLPLVGLPLLAHGGPHVGVEHVGVLRRGQDVRGALEQAGVVLGKGQHLRVGLVVRRAGDGHLHPALQAPDDEGVGHVVPVADVAQLQPFQLALVLPDGHQVGQHLAGVAEIGEAVDHGDGGILGQGLHLLLGEGADHNAVTEPGEHPGRVLHRLVPADLAVLVGEVDGVAPQLVDARLKGHPGPGGALLKNHGQGLPCEEGVGDARLAHGLQLVGGVQDLQDLFAGEVQQFE